MNGRAWLLAGISLHGCSFTLVFITAQIYLDERVDAAWRARAQALMALMTSGFGNLIGYLGSGWWFGACKGPSGQHWSLFWGGLALTVAVVLVYFLSAYHGIGKGILSEDRVADGGERATKNDENFNSSRAARPKGPT
jgi:MFS family permease